MILYDNEPFFFDTSDPTKKSETWLKLYSKLGFDTFSNVNNYIFGEGEIPRANMIQNQLYEEGVVCSFATGPSTWAILYSEGEYGTPVQYIEPNTLCLSTYHDNGIIFNSVQVFSNQPDNWPSDIDSLNQATPQIVSQMEVYSVASKTETIIQDIVGFIPFYVGDILSMILDVFWPTGVDPKTVWDDLSNYIHYLMRGLVDVEAINNLNEILGDIQSELEQIIKLKSSQDKLNRVNDLIELINDHKDDFLGGEEAKPETQLSYMIAFTSISLILLWLRVNRYEEISGKNVSEDANHYRYKIALDRFILPAPDPNTREIISYTSTIETAIANAVAWRTDSSIIYKEKYGYSEYYRVIDKLSGFHYYNYFTDSEADDFIAKLVQKESFNYEQQLKSFCAPVRSFPALLSEEPMDYIPPKERYELRAGNDNSSGTRSVLDLSERSLKVITIYYYNQGTNNTENDYYVQGIKFKLDNDEIHHFGTNGTSYTTYVVSSLESDELISSIYGAYNDHGICQLFIRTTKGLDLGLGRMNNAYNTLGYQFYVQAPQSVNYHLDSIEIIEDESRIQYISFIMGY